MSAQRLCDTCIGSSGTGGTLGDDAAGEGAQRDASELWYGSGGGGGGGAAVPATPSQEQATQESLFNGLSDEESAEPMAVGVVGSSVVAEEKIVVGVGVEVVPAVIAKDLASRLGGCLAAGEQRFRCIAW